jgi:hypothetical protein
MWLKKQRKNTELGNQFRELPSQIRLGLGQNEAAAASGTGLEVKERYYDFK